MLGIARNEIRQSKRRFVTTMEQLGHGRFESLRIRHGELVLDPWPTIVRSVKFGHATCTQMGAGSDEFELKKQIVELLAHVRSIDAA